MTYYKYDVTFTMNTEVIAEDEEEAIEIAKESLLGNDGYYVHDYIDGGEAKKIGKATKKEVKEYFE